MCRSARRSANGKTTAGFEPRDVADSHRPLGIGRQLGRRQRNQKRRSLRRRKRARLRTRADDAIHRQLRAVHLRDEPGTVQVHRRFASIRFQRSERHTLQLHTQEVRRDAAEILHALAFAEAVDDAGGDGEVLAELGAEVLEDEVGLEADGDVAGVVEVDGTAEGGVEAGAVGVEADL